MILNNDRGENCIGYNKQAEHIEINTPIVSLLLYEEGNYEELEESVI